MSNGETSSTSWHRRGAERAGLKLYLQVVREYWWLVAVALIVTTSAAIVYVATADKVYEAEAGVLVAPIPGEAQTLLSLGLISDSSDPLRGVETAAVLINTIEVAREAEKQLQGKLDPVPSAEQLLEDVTVEPVAESNLVSVIAKAPTPEAVAEIANAFGRAVTEVRSKRLRQKIDAQLPTLKQQTTSAPAGSDTKTALAGQLAQLELLRAGGDPTLRLETPATVPTTTVSPRTKLSIAAGLLSGLILGLGGAFAAYSLDPRLRREEQLRSAYQLPILARVPKWGSTTFTQLRRGRRLWKAIGSLSPQAVESYRSMGAIISGATLGRPQSILVTSPSAGDGKTSTSVNLASALALGGHKVILIDADLRHPDVSNMLSLRAWRGIESVLLQSASLRETLVTVPGYKSNLQALIAEGRGTTRTAVDYLAGEAGVDLMREAKESADYVIIDSPPLTEVVDALALAQTTDTVLLTVRVDRTKLSRIEQLADLLDQNRIAPTGFVLVGAPKVESTYYVSGRSIYAEDRGRTGVREPVEPGSWSVSQPGSGSS